MVTNKLVSNICVGVAVAVVVVVAIAVVSVPHGPRIKIKINSVFGRFLIKAFLKQTSDV